MSSKWNMDLSWFWYDLYGSLSHFGWSVRQLCEVTGISESTFYRLKNHAKPMTINWYLAVCRLMNMNAQQYIYKGVSSDVPEAKDMPF